MLQDKSRMKNAVCSGTAIASLIAGLMFVPIGQATATSMEKEFGSLSQGDAFDRVVTIAPDTKWVNVNQDQTVKFVDQASGKSFIWKFDTRSWLFDLARVAPPGILENRHIDAYVQSLPLSD